jgi:hypothetical protein
MAAQALQLVGWLVQPRRPEHLRPKASQSTWSPKIYKMRCPASNEAQNCGIPITIVSINLITSRKEAKHTHRYPKTQSLPAMKLFALTFALLFASGAIAKPYPAKDMSKGVSSSSFLGHFSALLGISPKNKAQHPNLPESQNLIQPVDPSPSCGCYVGSSGSCGPSDHCYCNSDTLPGQGNNCNLCGSSCTATAQSRGFAS